MEATKAQKLGRRATRKEKSLNYVQTQEENVKLSLYSAWRLLGFADDLRLPHFLDIRLTEGGKVVGPTRRPLFTPHEDSSFLLRD
jgi:hypothetical protein